MKEVMSLSDFIPLSIPNLSGNELAYVTEAVRDGWVSSVGPHVQKFEKEMADYLGLPFAIACMNGTAALHVSLLLVGVQPDDEVLAPNLTFVATLNAIRYCFAHPVLMDSEWRTMGMDVDKLKDFLDRETKFIKGNTVNQKTGRVIRAILPMHTLGCPVDMDPLLELCKNRNIRVIEDATESLGSSYRGRKAGTLAEVGCLSFNGNKIITTGGGGMILTADPELARRAKHLTTTAKTDPVEYLHDEVGYNYRMVNVLAALGLGQLEQLPDFVNKKRTNLKHYARLVEPLPGLTMFVEPDFAESNYWLYSLILDRNFPFSIRDLVQQFSAARIQVRPIWALMNSLPMYKDCQAYYCDTSLDIYRRTLNVPCSTHITEQEIDRVVSVLQRLTRGL